MASNPSKKPTVTFARKTSSGRYVSLSREDIDLRSYTVHMPPTPDNQPIEVAAAAGVHERLPCAMPECDGSVEKDEQGNDVFPCDCRFKMCKNCFSEAQMRSGDMSCPGCKQPYRMPEFDDNESSFSSIPPAPLHWTANRTMSTLQSSQKVNFDHSQWLFEAQATYGYGNAFWSKDSAYGDGDGEGDGFPDSSEEWKPLARRIPISAAIISPYRLLIVVRLIALAFFLTWRVKHKNHDAVWLWGMSVVCEIWFAFSWILDQLPKLCPINRSTNPAALRNQFESNLPAVDVFVSTADPDKEPPLVTAATILSILAVDYPVDRIACYLSDDGASLFTFEAMAEAASFAALWVPFCRKHDIEPRNPESYFALRRDPTKNKQRTDFVRDRRRVKREYDEFKVRVNGLPDSIRRRSDAFNAREEMKQMKRMKEAGEQDLLSMPVRLPKATWMADGTHWPGTWAIAAPEHSKGDHASILQVLLEPAKEETALYGTAAPELGFNFTEIDVRLPMLVYVSREKRPGYDHNKKAGAMNALVRASAVLSNGPFILNLDCDHYIYNTQAIREGMCFLIDNGGEDICFIQFPQRFEGIDPNDRYANNNTVFFDGNMRALDGLQGPMYVGTGCIFRRLAVYGFDPPPPAVRSKFSHEPNPEAAEAESETQSLNSKSSYEADLKATLLPKRFGNSFALIESIPVAEFQGRPLTHRSPSSFRLPRSILTHTSVSEAISVISCWFEDKTEWGGRVGWIYGSVTEDVVTGYRMHNRGWRSIYCVTAGRDAFRGSAPINLTDRLHQVLRWATGSVEIFFSRNNAFLASRRLSFLQRIAYLNVGIYPFTSVFLLVYCFLPALSLFSGHFIVETLSISFLVYLLVISITLTLLAILEVRWSGVGLEEWWRNEQFWLISGTSAHLAAVLQGMLKVVAGIEISFTLTAKSSVDEEEDAFADLYIVKWTSLMIPPITIMMVNIIAIAVASRGRSIVPDRTGASCSEAPSSASGFWPISTPSPRG